jgi:hypothetical protein
MGIEMTALYIGIYTIVALIIYVVALFAWALGIGMGYPYAKWYHWSNIGCICISILYPIAAIAGGILIFM